MLLLKPHAMYLCVLLAWCHILADATMEINENKIIEKVWKHCGLEK